MSDNSVRSLITAMPVTPPAVVPTMTGRHVSLRAATPSDYGFLYALETSGSNLTHWRLMGQAASPEQVVASAWEGVLALFIVTPTRREEPLGVVVLYGASFRHRFAYFAAIGRDDCQGTGLMAEACALLISFAFTTFDMRKLYAEAIASNVAAYGTALSSILVEEGRLREHFFVDGRYEDQALLSITRKSYQKLAESPWWEAPAIDAQRASNLTLEAFLQQLGSHLELDLTEVESTSRIKEDLGFDSLQMIEAVVFVEELAGRTISDQAIASWRTVADLYSPLT